MGWQFFVDEKPWLGSRALYISTNGPGRRAIVKPFSIEVVDQGAAFVTPTIEETREARSDDVGDVTGFLQASLDAAWSLGLRPKGFADHANELTATRYHLEDMRALALKAPVQDRKL